MHKAIPSDALVTAEDVQQIKGDIFRGEFKRLVLELVIREPEIAILIAENNEKVLNTVEGAALTDVQRDILGKRLSLLTWTPIILFDRAQRRTWNDFLPSEEVVDPDGKDAVEVNIPCRCEPNEFVDGVMVAIEWGTFQEVRPQYDEQTVRALLTRHGEAIAVRMMRAGIEAAVELFESEGKAS